MKDMPVKAKVYIGFMLGGGAAVVGGALLHWQCNDPGKCFSS